MDVRPRLPASFPLRLQDLSGQDARFCLSIKRFIKSLGVDPCGTALILACSGGADSLCLLLALRWLAPHMGFTLHIAHMDHGLRPEAEQEARALAALCRRLGVPFRLERTDILRQAHVKGQGVEEAGRDARYAFFSTFRRNLGAAWICTAHQRDDVLEDILMRFIRGASWPGLAGMPALCPERRILRPLLMTGRGEIEAFLERLGALPVRDASNQSTDYLRNRVRNTVIPLLLEENPNLAHCAATLWKSGQEDASYWAALAENLLPKNPGSTVLVPAKLRAQPAAVRLRLYMHALKRLKALDDDLAAHPLAPTLFRLDAAFAGPAPEQAKTFAFPGNVQATLSTRGIVFHEKKRIPPKAEDDPTGGPTATNDN